MFGFGGVNVEFIFVFTIAVIFVLLIPIGICFASVAQSYMDEMATRPIYDEASGRQEGLS